MSAVEQFPADWVVKPFGEVVSTVKGKKPKDNGPPAKKRTVPYINIKAFETGVPEQFASPGNYRDCSKDDILMVWDGARSGLVGRGVSGYIGSTLAKLKAVDVSSSYLYYFLQGQYGYINTNTKGVGIPHVDPVVLKAIPFPIAPRDQQDRIVAKIEKQFSRLDEAVASLKRVKGNLKRYKAAVLKAAVEGKLTEEWRKQNPDVEPASKLLDRILAERRTKWEEAELAKMKAKGKEPKNDKWKEEYKQLESARIDELPPVPCSWAWARLPQLGELNRGKSKHRPRNDPKLYDGKYPFVQTGDIRQAVGVLKDYTQTYSDLGLEQSRLWPEGTLCITIAANIADTAVLGLEACFPDSVAGFIPESDEVDIQYVEYFIRTAKDRLGQFAPATAQKNINLAILGEVALPLPPYQEQCRMVSELQKTETIVVRIESQIQLGELQIGRMRSSILKELFAGS